MKWRLLMGAVALAAALWSGWWVIGSGWRTAAIEDWLAARRAEGWQAEAAEVVTQGFPNRFDTRLVDVALANPDAGWAWRAPFLEILSMSWEPNAAILAFPPEQTIAAPGARARLLSEQLRASIRVEPGPSLALDRLSAMGEGLRLEDDAWRAGAARLEAHVRKSQAGTAPENSYDLYFGAEGVQVPQAVRNELDPTGALPEMAELLRIDARAAFERPLDRRTIEEEPPGVTAVSLRTLDARWGELALSATGRLVADARGYAEGEITVRAENWRAMLRAATRAGALDPNLAGLIESGLGLIATLAGDGDALEAPLVFRDGRMRLGPVAIGDAPRLLER